MLTARRWWKPSKGRTMEILEQVNKVIDTLKDSDELKNSFRKDPVKTVEKLLGVDLPDDVIDKVVKGVQAKISVDKVSGAVDALKKLF